MLVLWKESDYKPGQIIKKQRHHFADKDLCSQSYGFSSYHVWMWELDHKEGWVVKNWCFWTVVLEKTLVTPLDCKEIKPVNTEGNQLWIFIGRTDAEAEAPKLCPLDAKNWLIGKDPGSGKDCKQEEKGTQRMRRLDRVIPKMDMNLSKVWERAEDRGAWHAVALGVPKSQTRVSHWATWTTSKTCFFLFRLCVISHCWQITCSQFHFNMLFQAYDMWGT